MNPEYKDHEGKPIGPGWYENFSNELFFVEKRNSDFFATRPSGAEIKIFPLNYRTYLNCGNLMPVDPKVYKNQAQNLINFINTKQARLEQLAQSVQSTSKVIGHPFGEWGKEPLPFNSRGQEPVHQRSASLSGKAIQYAHYVDGSFDDPMHEVLDGQSS